MCFGVNSGENQRFSLCLTEVFTGWEATKALESILCRPSKLTLNVLPQAISQPSPMSDIVLRNEQSRGRMEKHVRLRGLYFSYHSALKWNYGGGGHFSSNGERSTRGGRLAGREGGERIYIAPSSVWVMMLKGCLPVLLTRIIIMDELNSTAHIKKRHTMDDFWHAAVSQCNGPHKVFVLMFTPFKMI